ncbi:hypothetical protein ACP4OV_028904 [Aristida adscensionis]
MPLRRLHGLLSAGASGAVSGHRLRRGLSTAASRPPWAMLYEAKFVGSPAARASLQLAEPPGASHILVPSHLVAPPPSRPDAGRDDVHVLLSRGICATSGDGLVLLHYMDHRTAAPVVAKPGSTPIRELANAGMLFDPDVTRFVCNPLSGQMVRLPDVDGTSKSMWSCFDIGILTQSERPHQPPDRYAVAALSPEHGVGERTFVLQRFLSQTSEWHKLDGLPSPLPLPLPRQFDLQDHEVVPFAGRLWWVDVSWGAVSADPFSDRPDLRFVELPRGSVTEPMDMQRLRSLGRYRRIGVSEGRLRYAEVSQEEPFVLSSFALQDDGNSWRLEHRLALSRLWAHWQEDTPRIGVVDPLNAGVMHLTTGPTALAVDMGKEKLLKCSTIGGDDSTCSAAS